MKTNRMIRMPLILACAASIACCQVRFMSGSPVPSSSSDFAVGLFQVGDDGSVQSLAELVPHQSGMNWGIDWVAVSPEAGIAVLISNRLIVVDLEKGAVVKSCSPPLGPPHSVWTQQWLLNTPSDGPVLAFSYFDSEKQMSTLAGWRADPSVECGKSSVKLDPIELSHITASGRFGIGDVGLWDGINLGVMVDADGNVKGNLGGVSFLYGYQVPPNQRAAMKRHSAAILINNPQIMVIDVSDRSADRRVLAFRKKDQTWHRVPLPPQRVADPAAPSPMPPIRGFGHFIAIAEVQPKDSQNPESAGRSEWKGASRMGPDVAYLLKQYKDVYPGRLHLYDLDTERTYTISTNQGDSEILLVDNNTVYYRASDRLYSAPITESGMGRARLLATADVIRDAHWAFIKH